MAVLEFRGLFDNRRLALLFASLVFLIFAASPDLIADPASRHLQECFCHDSDIITLLTAICRVFREKDPVLYGISPTEFIRLAATLSEIAGGDLKRGMGKMNYWVQTIGYSPTTLVDLLFLTLHKLKPYWMS
jgi:hypothetical protein